MIGIGKVIEINDTQYEIKRTLSVPPGELLSKELTDEMRAYWMAEKVFKSQNTYYFVNEIEEVEFIEIKRDE
jgi:hypothetical protein